MESKRLSMGKMVIETDRLKELFNLPKEVEFAKVELDLVRGEIEVIIMSAEPIERLTLPVSDGFGFSLQNQRRRRLPLETEIKAEFIQ